MMERLAPEPAVLSRCPGPSANAGFIFLSISPEATAR